jgi:dihydrodipicolinate synthase/N-acetylneuraminate lyase
VKAAMNHRGWTGGRVRPPLRPLTAEQIAELAPVVDAVLAATSPARAARAVGA